MIADFGGSKRTAYIIDTKNQNAPFFFAFYFNSAFPHFAARIGVGKLCQS
jgi:hypothetical protein